MIFICLEYWLPDLNNPTDWLLYSADGGHHLRVQRKDEQVSLGLKQLKMRTEKIGMTFFHLFSLNHTNFEIDISLLFLFTLKTILTKSFGNI